MDQENILFDNTGIPRISDFGISSITFDPNSNNASTLFRGYSLRWAAPEILEAPLGSEARRPTKMSDVYAFGMVTVEVRYDRPFHRLTLTVSARFLPGSSLSLKIQI